MPRSRATQVLTAVRLRAESRPGAPSTSSPTAEEADRPPGWPRIDDAEGDRDRVCAELSAVTRPRLLIGSNVLRQPSIAAVRSGVDLPRRVGSPPRIGISSASASNGCRCPRAKAGRSLRLAPPESGSSVLTARIVPGRDRTRLSSQICSYNELADALAAGGR